MRPPGYVAQDLVEPMNLPTRARGLSIVVAMACLGTACLAASPPGRDPGSQGASTRIRDSQIVPAGGGGCRCRGGECHCGHRTNAGQGHHADCCDGRCSPYCPVRPQHYGFYGTQWRRWNGQDVMTVSDERATTPALPPRMAVPGPDQESMQTPADEVEAPARSVPLDPREASPRFRQPDDESDVIVPLEPAPPEPEVELTAPKPAEPKAFSPPPAPMPDPEPAATVPMPQDDNLFNSSGGHEKARRKFAVGPGDPLHRTDDAVRPAGHGAPAKRKAVPRVSFDPTAEARRLRTDR